MSTDSDDPCDDVSGAAMHKWIKKTKEEEK